MILAVFEYNSIILGENSFCINKFSLSALPNITSTVNCPLYIKAHSVLPLLRSLLPNPLLSPSSLWIKFIIQSTNSISSFHASFAVSPSKRFYLFFIRNCIMHIHTSFFSYFPKNSL